jgi:hypothetical protein
MVLIDLQVKHIKFGVGRIVARDGNYIRVKFESVEKNFVYPDAFEKFLTLADGTVSDEIKADLALTNERKARILAAKHEENVRSMTHGIVIPGKEGTSESEEEESGYKNSSDVE